MELDQALIDKFVEEVKAELAEASELILLPCGTAWAWAASYMWKPVKMNFDEFEAYADAAGAELVACGVLKPDHRKHRGMPTRSAERMRVSQSWWRKAHADSSD
jgi:hypothetical protein